MLRLNPYRVAGREAAPGPKHDAGSDAGSYKSGEEDTDCSDSDFEGNNGYKRGGYHPVYVGEVYNKRYTVLKKLGWGHFSTVWLCEDAKTGEQVAMKVQKSAKHYTDAAYDEIQLLQTVAVRAGEAEAQIHAQYDSQKAEAAKLRAVADEEAREAGFAGADDPAWLRQLPSEEAEERRRELAVCDEIQAMPPPGRYDPSVVRLIDSFEHAGPHGTHMCMVFETLGDNLLALIKAYRYQGIPLDLVRKFTRQTCLGLDFLHSACGIIHTDLKPENVLLTGKLPPPPLLPEELEGVTSVEQEMTPEEVAAEVEKEKIAARKLGHKLPPKPSAAAGGAAAASGKGPAAAAVEPLDDSNCEELLKGVTGAERKKLKKKLKKKKAAAAAAAGGGAGGKGGEDSLAVAASRLLPSTFVTANFIECSDANGYDSDAESGDDGVGSGRRKTGASPVRTVRLLNASGAPLSVEEHAAQKCTSSASLTSSSDVTSSLVDSTLTSVDVAAVSHAASVLSAASSSSAAAESVLRFAPSASSGHGSVLMAADPAALQLRLGASSSSPSSSWALSLFPAEPTSALVSAISTGAEAASASSSLSTALGGHCEGDADVGGDDGDDADSATGSTGLPSLTSPAAGGGKSGKAGFGGKGATKNQRKRAKQKAKKQQQHKQAPGSKGTEEARKAAATSAVEALTKLTPQCVFIEPLPAAAAGGQPALNATGVIRALSSALQPQSVSASGAVAAGSGASGEGAHNGGAGAVVTHSSSSSSSAVSPSLTLWRVSVPLASLSPALAALERCLASVGFLSVIGTSGGGGSSGAGKLIESVTSALGAGADVTAAASPPPAVISSSPGSPSLSAALIGLELSSAHDVTSTLKALGGTLLSAKRPVAAAAALTSAVAAAATDGPAADTGGSELPPAPADDAASTTTAATHPGTPCLWEGVTGLPPFRQQRPSAGARRALQLRPIEQRLQPWFALGASESGVTLSMSISAVAAVTGPIVSLSREIAEARAAAAAAAEAAAAASASTATAATPQLTSPTLSTLTSPDGAASDAATSGASPIAGADAEAASPAATTPTTAPAPSLPRVGPSTGTGRWKVMKVPREMTPEQREEAEARYRRDFAAWEAQVAALDAKVVDLGNACWVDRHFSEDIQTRQYRSPEVIIGRGYDTSADMWSLGCMVFELLTGDLLFDPVAGDGYDRDEDHLAQMIELAGPPPGPEHTSGGERSDVYFNSRGELRHIKELRYWGPASVLVDKYGMAPLDAALVESFLLPTLAWDVGSRATAEACLMHPWLALAESPEDPATPAGFMDWRSNPAAAGRLLIALLGDPTYGPHLTGPTSTVAPIAQAAMDSGAEGLEDYYADHHHSGIGGAGGGRGHGRDGGGDDEVDDDDGTGTGFDDEDEEDDHGLGSAGSAEGDDEADDDGEDDEDDTSLEEGQLDRQTMPRHPLAGPRGMHIARNHNANVGGSSTGHAPHARGAAGYSADDADEEEEEEEEGEWVEANGDGGDDAAEEEELAAMMGQLLSMSDEQAAALNLKPSELAALRQRFAAAGFGGAPPPSSSRRGAAGTGGSGRKAAAAGDREVEDKDDLDDELHDGDDDAAGAIWGVGAQQPSSSASKPASSKRRSGAANAALDVSGAGSDVGGDEYEDASATAVASQDTGPRGKVARGEEEGEETEGAFGDDEADEEDDDDADERSSSSSSASGLPGAISGLLNSIGGLVGVPRGLFGGGSGGSSSPNPS